MRKLLLLIIFLSYWTIPLTQLSYGTTELLHAPSADMQKNKTMMLDGNFLHQESTPPKFNFNTWNYCLNVMIFPFLEIAYTCTSFMTESLGLDRHDYSGPTDQNRYFSARLRVLKESEYIPAVVLGTPDPLTLSEHKSASTIGNGYFCCYYLAAAEHFQPGGGTLGVYLSYLYNHREDCPLNGVAGDITYNPSFAPYLDVITEYDSEDLAMGAIYLLSNHIHFQFELQRMKRFSGGLYYKIYLR